MLLRIEYIYSIRAHQLLKIHTHIICTQIAHTHSHTLTQTDCENGQTCVIVHYVHLYRPGNPSAMLTNKNISFRLFVWEPGTVCIFDVFKVVIDHKRLSRHMHELVRSIFSIIPFLIFVHRNVVEQTQSQRKTYVSLQNKPSWQMCVFYFFF